jgi:SAM-dependent methyltransferase
VTTARERRLVFGEVADTYDRVRPGYPPEVVDDLVALVGSPARVLEIGAGTGKATEALVAAGFDVLALEPSPTMAAVLHRRAPTARVVETSFEGWAADEGPFDVVLAAQSWHWVDPEAGLARAADVLAPDGVLALLWNHAIEDEHPLRAELDAVYRREAPDLAGNPAGAYARPHIDALAASERFGPVEVREHRWLHDLATADYLDLLRTHSDKRLLADDARERLLAGIAEVVDAHGGRIAVPHTAMLVVARAR